MAQPTPIQLLLPAQLEAQLSATSWVDEVVAFGIVSGAAGVFALPLTGSLSDRTTSRMGRRRTWILGGASHFSAALILLGVQLVVVLTLSQVVGCTLVAVLLVLLVLPFVLGIADAVLPRSARSPLVLRCLVAGFWINPRQYPDFGWTLTSRILVNFCNALGTSLLLYFLQDGLAVKHAEDVLLVLILIYMVSDRLGRRKIFVFGAAALQGVAALKLAFVPVLSVAMVAAGIFGLGYGRFLSVDQALATQVLPDAHTRGKDLGIMNIATAVPQAIAPLIGAFVVAALAGFQGLFMLSAIAALLGALVVLPIRSVR